MANINAKPRGAGPGASQGFTFVDNDRDLTITHSPSSIALRALRSSLALAREPALIAKLQAAITSLEKAVRS